MTVHDLNYLYGRNAFSTWRHQRRTRALMRRTDVVVAISHHTAADVRRHLGWSGPLEVIHNGARSFVDAPRRPLPGWDDQPRAPFLFHLSRMSPSKNPQALIGLARSWPEMTFVLCGPPSDDAKQLRDTVRLPNLQFHLGIDDAQKAWAYAHCSGFLFPSLTEGFGLPPIEAMHFGKPVFLARRTCLPEIGGDAADYFDDFEPAAMRRVIETGLARQRAPGRADAIRAHAAHSTGTAPRLPTWRCTGGCSASPGLSASPCASIAGSIFRQGRLRADDRQLRRRAPGPPGQLLALLTSEARDRGLPSCARPSSRTRADDFAAQGRRLELARGDRDAAPERPKLRRCGIDQVAAGTVRRSPGRDAAAALHPRAPSGACVRATRCLAMTSTSGRCGSATTPCSTPLGRNGSTSCA